MELTSLRPLNAALPVFLIISTYAFSLFLLCLFIGIYTRATNYSALWLVDLGFLLFGQVLSHLHFPLFLDLFISVYLGWCQDNRNRSNQESKFDFLATRQQLGKIDGGQQKIKLSAPTDNQIYRAPANPFSPSAGTTLVYILGRPVFLTVISIGGTLVIVDI